MGESRIHYFGDFTIFSWLGFYSNIICNEELKLKYG